MSKLPNLLYKYKQLLTIEDLNRVLQVFKENAIYYPDYKKLNDPLEGAGHNIHIDPWAGISLHELADVELGPIREEKLKYRVLSLSSDPSSPQLWAHYAGNYCGICFCFSTKGSFQRAREVIYENPPYMKGVLNDDFEKAVHESFFYKQSGWRHEKEWRVIEKTEEDYFKFNSKDLIGVIIGERVPAEIKKIMVNYLPETVKALRTKVGFQTYTIHFLPWDYEVSYDGIKLPYIDNLEEYFL